MATPLDELASVLAYTETDGFVVDASRAGSGSRKYLIDRAKSRVGVDAVYFAGPTPLVYFRAFDGEASERELADLHRRAWNDSRVPILIVSTRRQLRVYDVCATPSQDPPAGEDGRIVVALERVTKVLQDDRLAPFKRQHVESGATWRQYPDRFRNETRCDRTLLQNLRITRDRLFDADLPANVIHELLPRIILLLYLQHREVLDARFFAEFGAGANIVEILGNHAATYRLFDLLAHRFNGDLLPVSDKERASIRPHHLDLLSQLLRGSENFATGQLSLWPMYDFNVIPTELISSIYELFLRSGEAGATARGLHYTPLVLVELLLNEVLPWPDTRPSDEWRPPRVLDPACGSGIFLVESYRRIVETVKLQRGLDRVPVGVLRDVLTECIFGVDEVGAAVKIAAFSLYLTMLDYLQPKAIWQYVTFPKLTASNGGPQNLSAIDAFDPRAFTSADRFDVIVGNPPWQRNYIPTSAHEFCRVRSLPVAKEIAHAFLWLAAELTSPQGRAALFATSKWLFNREKPDQDFRNAFFERNQVDTILNFSALRRSLFPNAIGPASAVVYSPRRHGSDELHDQKAVEILYCAPQARRSGPAPSAFLTDASEWKLIPCAQATAPNVWKVLTWGTWRDYRLFQKLRGDGQRTLKDFIKRRPGWHYGVGFQPFDPEKNKAVTTTFKDRELERRPYLPAASISQYVVPRNAIRPSFGENVTFRRRGQQKAYEGPKIVVKEGQSGGEFCAAYVSAPCTFKATVTGIVAPPHERALLKALTVYLNSSIAVYFTFHNSSSWGIERERVSSNEWLALPADILNDPDAVGRLAALYDEIADADRRSIRSLQRQADNAVFRFLSISRADRLLIDDFVRVTLPIVQRKPIVAATERLVHGYLSACSSHLAALLPPVQGIAWIGSSPLVIAEFRTASSSRPPEVRRSDTLVQQQLARLDQFLIQQESESVFLRRHARLSLDDAIYIVKPADADLWTASAGISDADEIIADFLAHDAARLSGTETDRR